ncbi:MAG: tRNA pseudouridine(13) synthase TruD, partial [Chloroflexi bacterium]|nr:tRNA pseudouridine(13) synthase TruD [Chloroflexota bacterium]
MNKTTRPGRAREAGLLPRYLTADLPGIGGRQRVEPEDFIVEEIPLYGPTGQGQHTLFAIEKRGISTQRAMQRIATALGVPQRLLSSAGLKDAEAVTRQTLSIEGVDPERLLALELPDIRVLWAARHRNRLKIGHLRGNRFIVRIRDVGPEAVEPARRILQTLQAEGVPNGFGYQRFGLRGDSHLLGRCLIKGDVEGFLRLYLGSPRDDDIEPVRRARELYEAGRYQEALAAWPAADRAERETLAILAQGRAPQIAVRQIPKWIKRLLVAAYQAFLFNRLLDERLPTWGLLEQGDLAVKHENGAFFLVEDPVAEQPRADRLEISPSGPLYSSKVRLAQGRPGERERRILEEEGLTLDDWRLPGVPLEGARRPFRVPLGEVAISYAEGLVLRFTLPPGAYASNVLDE